MELSYVIGLWRDPNQIEPGRELEVHNLEAAPWHPQEPVRPAAHAQIVVGRVRLDELPRLLPTWHSSAPVALFRQGDGILQND